MEVSKIKTNTVNEIISIKKEDATKKKTNLSLPNDKVELSPKENVSTDKKKMSTGKKVGIGVAVFAVGVTALELAIAIGRNPVKAAKVLKGNLDILEPSYKRAMELTEELLNRKGVTSYEELLSVFKKPKIESGLDEGLSHLDEYLKTNNLKMPEIVEKSYATIKNKFITFKKEFSNALQNGDELTQMGQNFSKNNSKDAQTVTKYLEELMEKQRYEDHIPLSNIKYKFSEFAMQFECEPLSFIEKCPEGILPNNGILYHGTMKPKGIFKTGMTPFTSKQLDQYARELGAGIYTTPDVKVATNFTGFYGKIIPVKLSEANIALIDEKMQSKVFTDLCKFIDERYTPEEIGKLNKKELNAFVETVFRKIFKDAGYDAAYIPKGVVGANPLAKLMIADVNEIFGRKQSQVVVFSPEKLEIVSRSFSERLSDVKTKYQALLTQIKYQLQHPMGI